MSKFVDMYGGRRTSGNDRKENDHYPTPPWATYALVEMEREHIDKHLVLPGTYVLEPSAGRGWMAAELARHFPVIARDVVEYADPLFPCLAGVDYLECRSSGGLMITNPPYMKDLPQKFVEKSVHENSYTAVLCRLTWGESKKRYSFFKKHPPSRVLIFSSRFSCMESHFDDPKKAEGGMVAYAWWVWDENRRSSAVDWIAPGGYKRWKDSLG
jgi:hypothetical protein